MFIITDPHIGRNNDTKLLENGMNSRTFDLLVG